MKENSNRPIIAICGSSGLQGSSVVKWLLEDGTFQIRAVTRNERNCAELAALGVEIWVANYDEPATMRRAFEGAYGVFAVTNFWEPGVGLDGEIRQGCALVDAALDQKVQHFVYSALDGGPLEIPHCESKWRVVQYALCQKGMHSTGLVTSFFFENALRSAPFPITRVSSDAYELSWDLASDIPMASLAASDIGKWVLAIFKGVDRWSGQCIKVASQFLTPRDYARTFSRVTGKTCNLKHVSCTEFERKRGSITDELWLNGKWFIDNPAPPARDLELSYLLHPQAVDWAGFVENNMSWFLSLPIQKA